MRRVGRSRTRAMALHEATGAQRSVQPRAPHVVSDRRRAEDGGRHDHVRRGRERQHAQTLERRSRLPLALPHAHAAARADARRVAVALAMARRTRRVARVAVLGAAALDVRGVALGARSDARDRDALAGRRLDRAARAREAEAARRLEDAAGALRRGAARVIWRPQRRDGVVCSCCC